MPTQAEMSRRAPLDTWVGPFLEAIAANPGNALHRLILADALEEHGYDAEAAGQRWLVVNERWPGKVGWWSEFSGAGKSSSRLPDVFARPGLSYVTSPTTPLGAERAFLRRSGELAWVNGEPAEERAGGEG